jgi:hypothetical protein
MIKPARVLRNGSKNIRKPSLHLEILGTRKSEMKQEPKNVRRHFIKSSRPGDLTHRSVCAALL